MSSHQPLELPAVTSHLIVIIWKALEKFHFSRFGKWSATLKNCKQGQKILHHPMFSMWQRCQEAQPQLCSSQTSSQLNVISPQVFWLFVTSSTKVGKVNNMYLSLTLKLCFCQVSWCFCPDAITIIWNNREQNQKSQSSHLKKTIKNHFYHPDKVYHSNYRSPKMKKKGTEGGGFPTNSMQHDISKESWRSTDETP